MSEKLYQVALEFVPGIGDIIAKNLIAYCGSASSVYLANDAKLKKVPGIGLKAISLLREGKKDSLKKAEQVIAACERHHISILHYTDSNYPKHLKQVADAPNVIYLKGNSKNWPRTLAIVGTRNATDYGKTITEKIVEEAKQLDLLIVSGLAYGIDITAHKAALKHHLPTVAVLAGGLDKIYPAVHKKTAEEILEQGALISENPPGTEAEPHFFPARNRIIAGMSDAVIVVEAARKGGALITANIADSYNKSIFAVPGDLSNKYSEGCNYLIRNQKAIIYTGIEDLQYHLNWDEQSVFEHEKKQLRLANLSANERSLYEILEHQKEGVAIDNLSWKAQIPLNQLASLLLGMEFQGLVKSLPGKKYKLN